MMGDGTEGLALMSIPCWSAGARGPWWEQVRPWPAAWQPATLEDPSACGLLLLTPSLFCSLFPDLGSGSRILPGGDRRTFMTQ